MTDNTPIIEYADRIESTKLLGPYDRAVLWVFGCCFDCKGCIAYNYRYGKYKTETPENMARWFLETNQEHITISGGEPTLQAGPLSSMIEEIRTHRDIGVIVYTGFVYEDLKNMAANDPTIQMFLSNIDILIDGPYIDELNDNKPYRGSSNQRIIPLTDRYKNIMDDYYNSDGRKVEIKFSNNKTMMIGVPSRDQESIWQDIKKSCEEID